MNCGKQLSGRTGLLFHQTKLPGWSLLSSRCCSVNVWLDGSSAGLSEAYWSCSNDQAVYSLRTPHRLSWQWDCGNRWWWILWKEGGDGFRRWSDLIWSNTHFSSSSSSSVPITCQMFLRWVNFPTRQTHRSTHHPEDPVHSVFIHMFPLASQVNISPPQMISLPLAAVTFLSDHPPSFLLLPIWILCS